MFTACESGRELVSDAGTAYKETANETVKPHAAYVSETGGKKVSQGEVMAL